MALAPLAPRFLVDDQVAALVGALRYEPRDHAFDFDPGHGQAPHERQTLAMGGRSSLLLDGLQLEVGTGTGRVLFPWGVCPHERWLPVSRTPISAPPGGLYVVDRVLDDGVSVALGEPWDWLTDVDQANGTVFIDHCSLAPERHVEICTGVVVGLARRQLAALQLRPTHQPSDIAPAGEASSPGA